VVEVRCFTDHHAARKPRATRRSRICEDGRTPLSVRKIREWRLLIVERRRVDRH
jgi:hypothetical protein